MRSQIYYQCIAGANSPLRLVRKGLEEYIIGYDIPAAKLVLGLPWYAYQYPCENLADSICHTREVRLIVRTILTLRQVPFRGAPCSDAAGNQIDYSTVVSHIAKSTVAPEWDSISATPFLTINGTTQIWYDNEHSLSLKYGLASQLNLRGVGMWHVDALDYSGKETPVESTAGMWNALHDAVPKAQSWNVKC